MASAQTIEGKDLFPFMKERIQDKSDNKQWDSYIEQYFLWDRLPKIIQEKLQAHAYPVLTHQSLGGSTIISELYLDAGFDEDTQMMTIIRLFLKNVSHSELPTCDFKNHVAAGQPLLIQRIAPTMRKEIFYLDYYKQYMGRDKLQIG